jgi:hypothetical protein
MTRSTVPTQVRDAIRLSHGQLGRAYPVGQPWMPTDDMGMVETRAALRLSSEAESPGLVRYQAYTREQVHDVLAPQTPFSVHTGTWGLHGVVRVQPDRSDWVFFVTYGRRQGGHRFQERITPDGVLTWQSQPSQGLDDPRVQDWIRHDPARSTIHLFLRTANNEPYWYLGRLQYVDHDPYRERPVSFRWRILDWDPPDDIREAVGLPPKSRTYPVGEPPGPRMRAAEGRQTIPFDLAEAVRRLHLVGYRIAPDDLANIIVALKVRPFVIFSGRSGTGKTTLAKGLSRVFGWPFYLIAVSPAWADPEALLGFVSPLDEQWGHGALEPLLLDKPDDVLLCLDEFNVAKVEHYFSDFISAMDHDTRAFWGPLATLQRINRKRGSHEQLTLPATLKVIATMNFDDSVQSLTPRVLDRANLIEFDVKASDELAVDGELHWERIEDLPPMMWPDWSAAGPVPAIDAKIRTIWTLLKGSRGQFGHRVAQEIRRFVQAGEVLGTTFGDTALARVEALLDRQIVQRILPKFHGTALQRDITALTRLAAYLSTEVENSGEGDASDAQRQAVMDRALRSGHYQMAIQKIIQLADSHTVDGYASFW